MYKIIDCQPEDTTSGDLFCEVIRPGQSLIKTASHQLHPDITRYISQVKSCPDKIYILVNALGAGEYYSCFPAGTGVRTGNGNSVPIETLKVGDLVVDRLGRPAPITRTYNKPYSGPGIKFRASGMLTPVVSTANHKFWVIKREQVVCQIDKAKQCKPGTCQVSSICKERSCQRTAVRYDPEWVAAEDLRTGDYVTVPIPDRGVGARTWAWSVALARVIGYWLAEGSFLKTDKAKTGLTFAFHVNERTTLVADLITQLHALEEHYVDIRINGPYIDAETNTCTVQVNHVTLALRVARAVGEYSTGKRFSGEVYWQTPDILQNMLATYLDGDGTRAQFASKVCAGVSGRYTITTASKELAEDVQWIASRLGVTAAVCEAVPAGTREILGTVCECSAHYHVSFTNAQGAFLRGLCEKYADVPALQIKEHTFMWNGLVCRPVREIEQLDLEQQVFNLEVEGDHSYTVGNGVVAKNCNYNGDWFEETELNPKDVNADYGYKTFLSAGVYRNHSNRDKTKSIGIVRVSVYNQAMHRVELVIEVDAALCEEHGHPDLFDKLSRGEKLAVSMGCVLDPEYPVLTLQGYKNISEIQVGDSVLTHAGSWKLVTEVHHRLYTGPVVDVQVAGLPLPLPLTADHPMLAKVFGAAENQRPYVHANEFEAVPFDWAHAKHLSIGDHIQYIPPVFMKTRHAAIDDVRLARVMGFYLAEGSFCYNNGQPCTVQFSCHMDDDLPRVVPELLSSLFPTITCNIRACSNSAPGLSVDVHSTEFACFLDKYLGRHSKNKVIPPEIFVARPEVKFAFLGAWLSGDGFVDQKGVHISSANRNLVLQGRDLLATVGVVASIYKITHKAGVGFNAQATTEYTLNISVQDANQLVPYAERKLAKLTKYVAAKGHSKNKAIRSNRDGTLSYRVKAVTRRNVVDVPVYNFEVADDESYTLAGLISHNCRVAHDICSICGNQSKVRETYCEHAKHQLGQTLADGRKVCVYNPKPKFFDISIVVIGADRTSYVMSKLASRQRQVVSSAQRAEDVGLVDDITPVKNFLKQALARKVAGIVKEIPALAAKVMPTVDAHEEDLPSDILDLLGGCAPRDALAATSAAGIVLKPREYQRIILVCIGHKPMADDLDHHQCCFVDSDEVDDSLEFGRSSPDVSSLIKMLLPFIASRSAFEGPLTRRLSECSGDWQSEPRQRALSPLLLKISSAYNGYRQRLLQEMPEVVANITQRDISLLAAINEPLLEENLLYGVLTKKAEVPSAPLALLGAVSLAYFYGAHVRQQQRQPGEKLGAIDDFVAQHPVFASSVFVGLARLGTYLQSTGKLDDLSAK